MKYFQTSSLKQIKRTIQIVLMVSASATTIVYPSINLNSFVPSLEMNVAQAQHVYGAILEKYRSIGGRHGPLGLPTTSESDADDGGRFNEFEEGYIYWHPTIGAYAVYGALGKRWDGMSRERGALGYPLTDERDALNGGRFNEFEYGYIYWHPDTGAYAVYGDIGQRWNNLGRERGSLGYPISNEESAGGRDRISYFQNGYIYWNSENRATRVVYTD